MGQHTNVSTDVIASDASNRKWTAQELFGKSLRFTSYNGESEGDWVLAKLDPERGKATEGWDNFLKEVEGERGFSCNFTAINTIPGNLFLMLAEMNTWIANVFTTKMFSNGFVCTNPDGKGQAGCINLLGVIGGSKGKGEGILGSLRDSIFVPLAVLTFVLVGIWVMYEGLVKRKFRSALFGVLWSIGIFSIGLLFMLKPQLLASIPQNVNSTISTCIVGAMNGQSCLTGDVTAPSSMVGEECTSMAATSAGEGAALSANAMSCNIWKSFVLEPFARGQFGVGYDDLYLKNPPAGREVWKQTPKDVEPYGVAFKSSGSANSYRNKTVEVGGTKVYNMALYQLYIGSNVKTEGDKMFTLKTDDPRWFNVAVPAKKDPTMWEAWKPGVGGGFQRVFIGVGAMIISFIVSVSLVIFSFFGMVYMLAGTILITFAPLFFLFGIEPGKGRRIFLGWLEAITSSILKYMASSLLVIIALALYSAILSSSDSYASSFIGIIIMVGVLGMYRKEIINLLGQSNLGGQKLSNAVGEKISEKSKRTKDFATATVGGAVGGAAAAMGTGTGTLQGAYKGATSGAKRDLKRGTSMVSGITRQFDATSRELKKDDDKQKEKNKAAEALANRANEEGQSTNDKPTEGEGSTGKGGNAGKTGATGGTGNKPTEGEGGTGVTNPTSAEDVLESTEKNEHTESNEESKLEDPTINNETSSEGTEKANKDAQDRIEKTINDEGNVQPVFVRHPDSDFSNKATQDGFNSGGTYTGNGDTKNEMLEKANKDRDDNGPIVYNGTINKGDSETNIVNEAPTGAPIDNGGAPVERTRDGGTGYAGGGHAQVDSLTKKSGEDRVSDNNPSVDEINRDGGSKPSQENTENSQPQSGSSQLPPINTNRGGKPVSSGQSQPSTQSSGQPTSGNGTKGSGHTSSNELPPIEKKTNPSREGKGQTQYKQKPTSPKVSSVGDGKSNPSSRGHGSPTPSGTTTGGGQQGNNLNPKEREVKNPKPNVAPPKVESSHETKDTQSKMGRGGQPPKVNSQQEPKVNIQQEPKTPKINKGSNDFKSDPPKFQGGGTGVGNAPINNNDLHLKTDAPSMNNNKTTKPTGKLPKIDNDK